MPCATDNACIEAEIDRLVYGLYWLTEEEDYISLTDIARYKNPNEPIDIIKNWIRSRTTIEFIGLWEQLHNPDFKAVEFDRFMYEAGSNLLLSSRAIRSLKGA